MNIFRERTHTCIILQETEVGDAEKNAIRCFLKALWRCEGESGVKYSVSTRHRSNTFAILNIVCEQYLRCVYARLPILKRRKRRIFPRELPTRGPFFLSPSPRYLENIPGRLSSFLFLAASRFTPPVLSPVLSIRLLGASRFTSDY